MRTFKSTQQDMQARIVREVRSGRATSRGVLAEQLEIAPSTMGIHVDDLVERGFLVESGLDRGPTGRPKRLLKLVSDAGWFAGWNSPAGACRPLGSILPVRSKKAFSRPFRPKSPLRR